MNRDIIKPERSTPLWKNGDSILKILLDTNYHDSVFIINGSKFITESLTDKDLSVNPNENFMIINKIQEEITVQFSEDVDELEIVYDPYKFETLDKETFSKEYFLERYDIPDDYVDTLPKWYSFKFTYPDYNLIFIRPQLGISIQIHDQRNEIWEILEGNPIILNGNKVYYNVENGTIFEIPIHAYHTVINPNTSPNDFVLLKERWSGTFDEKDIERIFNPNMWDSSMDNK